MIRASFSLPLLLTGMLLAGCATKPQTPIGLPAETWHQGHTKVGVVMTDLPKTDFTYPGAGCLLCMAAASMANSTLIDYTRTLPNDELKGLKQEIADLLVRNKQDARLIEAPLNLKALPDFPHKPDYAPKDFSSFASQYDIDLLYVVQIDSLGISRNYSAYVPTGDPKGTVTGAGYLVDLHTNKYQWFEPVAISKTADGAWDEPPKFPGLSNAYFQAVEQARDVFKKPLVQ